MPHTPIHRLTLRSAESHARATASAPASFPRERGLGGANSPRPSACPAPPQSSGIWTPLGLGREPRPFSPRRGHSSSRGTQHGAPPLAPQPQQPPPPPRLPTTARAATLRGCRTRPMAARGRAARLGAWAGRRAPGLMTHHPSSQPAETVTVIIPNLWTGVLRSPSHDLNLVACCRSCSSTNTSDTSRTLQVRPSPGHKYTTASI